MLEPRKLKVVCFKARLTKNLKSLTFTVDTQLLTTAPHGSSLREPNSPVRIFSYPELRGDVMYLRGVAREKSDTSTQEYDDVDNAFAVQAQNLRAAGRLLKRYIEQGHYGGGKQCQA